MLHKNEVESILFFNMLLWFENLIVRNKLQLQTITNLATKMVGKHGICGIKFITNCCSIKVFSNSPLPPPCPSQAPRSPGSQCVGYRSSRKQHRHGPAALVLWPGPSWPGLLPGLHSGGPLSTGGGRRGGAVRRRRSIRGGGTSGRPGNIRPLLRPRAEGVSRDSVCVCVFLQLLAHVRD